MKPKRPQLKRKKTKWPMNDSATVAQQLITENMGNLKSYSPSTVQALMLLAWEGGRNFALQSVFTAIEAELEYRRLTPTPDKVQ